MAILLNVPTLFSYALRLMKDFRLHYKSFFSIEPDDPAPGQLFWSQVIKTVGGWLYDKYADTRSNKQFLIKPWLFNGGEWQSGLVDVSVETKTLRAGAALELPPRYWTFRHCYRDREYRQREWQVNIGITSVEVSRFDVVVTYSHCLIPGHFGPEPPPPLPEVPGVLTYLFELPDCRIHLNERPLYSFPQPLFTGHAETLVKMLTDPGRKTVVAVSYADGPSAIELDLPYLSQLLIANANIYYYDQPAFDQELRHHFPIWYGTYYCPRNAIRIYQPGLNLHDPLDSKRHRYFYFHEYERIHDLEDVLFKGLQRRRDQPFSDFVAFREDIFHKEKAVRLRQLGELRALATDKEEYVKLLENEVSLLQGEKEQWAAQVKKKEEELAFSEDESEELADRIRHLEFDKKQLGEMMTVHDKRRQQYQRQQLAVQHLAKLPTSLGELVAIISELQSARLLFLPEARASAGDTEYDDLNGAWSLLWHMATTLWELRFIEQADLTTLQNEFKARSGYEVTFTEGKHTKLNDRLMAQRLRIYKGREVDMLPHAKIDKGGRHLRVHFHVDREDQLIVIGHCGDHLETDGTRRRKE